MRPPLSDTPPMLMVPPTLLAACGYLTLWCCFHLMRRFSCRLPSLLFLFFFGFDRQPPCTLWCRLRAAGECRRHARATAAYPQTVSWPPLPFFQQIPAIFHKNPVVSLGILSGSLLGSLLLILLFGSPSPHLLVPLPAHIQAAQGLPNSSPILFLHHFPACLLLDTLLAWYTLFPPLHP